MNKKRRFVIVILAIMSVSLFADSHDDVRNVIAKFLNNGGYVLVERKSKIVYYPSKAIAQFSIEGGFLKFLYQDSGNDLESEKIDLKKFTIEADDKDNIIIKEK